MLTSSLVFDPTETAASSNVGAYVRAGSDGDLIASQTIAAEEWLNVASALFDSAGNGITSTGGALDVNFASGNVALASEFDEDTAHTSGDKGQFILGLRVDDLSAVPAAVLAGTEGDYQGLISNANGALYVAGVDFDIRDLTAASDTVASWLSDASGNPIDSTTGSLNVHVANAGDIDVDDDLADTAILGSATAVSTTAVNVVTSALANRKHMFLANLGNKALFFGQSGVTPANGFPLFPREKLAARIGPSIAPQIIGDAGSSSEDLRVLELS